MASKTSTSVTEFAKNILGPEVDLTEFKNDDEVLSEVLSLIEEKVEDRVKEKVKHYEEVIEALEEQLKEYSNPESTSERTFSEWQKYDPKGLKSMKLNDPERYNKIPGRH